MASCCADLSHQHDVCRTYHPAWEVKQASECRSSSGEQRLNQRSGPGGGGGGGVKQADLYEGLSAHRFSDSGCTPHGGRAVDIVMCVVYGATSMERAPVPIKKRNWLDSL